jgi:hypothetical protein
MSSISLSKRKTAPIQGALTAIGFAVAHYAYITLSDFFYSVGFANVGLYAIFAALFFWFRRRVKESAVFSRLMLPFIVYLIERFLSLGYLLQQGYTDAFRIQLFIAIPILFFMFKGAQFCKDKKRRR